MTQSVIKHMATAQKKTTTHKPDALLLFSDSEKNADMLYFGKLFVPDPFLALRIQNRRIAVLNALEIGRAHKESIFNDILPLEDYATIATKKFGEKGSTYGRIARLLAKEYKINTFRVRHDFPIALADELRSAGLKLDICLEDSLFPQRETKSAPEADAIRRANRACAAAFRAVEQTLRMCSVRKGRIMLMGRALTSQRLRALAEKAAIENGAMPANTIVAGGEQACDPHCQGDGPLEANRLIIVDIFPKDQRSGYHGDMTRTFLKGHASDAQKALVAAVKEAHKSALAQLKAGVSGKTVHHAAASTLARYGYQTRRREDGRHEGFFHGTGHGLGLDVHEEPRVSPRGGRLKKGSVVTIEPGLYYPGLGGCRIEDVAWVQPDGYQLLSRHPYRWQIK